ncbi:MAG: bifunctional 2-polyprenyl-6-hydroxyphenol methylase/3-demethylubiquinol 3-O-methyltransferase UbiG [Alphaproteobacteria bacterium]|nr:MAG: bifunctional 2-polyprenyl-6-hydroxyphenol methylase/3-demethylubiquinol 3-O-methyltransferase UbiG [Alphaproteobacteria bacterium]
MASSVEPVEIDRFARLAATWWDADGPFKPLHRLGPARLGYIRDQLARHYRRDTKDLAALAGLRILDMGCGGGLIAEPLARLGAQVTGADAAAENIAVARAHAAQMDLDIAYRHATVEQLASEGARFDAVLILEIVEHVADIGLFLGCCRRLLARDGLLVFSTLNRTARSFLAAIIGAEYVLRWLPRGTHDWRKFVTPREMHRHLDRAGFAISDMHGLTFQPLAGTWRLTSDLGVNYIGSATAQ